MIGAIIITVIAVVGIDALYGRAQIRLRTRAAESTRPKSHEIINRSPEGWRTLEEIQRESEAASVADDGNPFAQIGRSSRRSR